MLDTECNDIGDDEYDFVIGARGDLLICEKIGLTFALN
jgi:hypothetical protein